MSYEDVINIINAHYGWSMDAHEPEYKGEIKEKMQAMKQLVSELSIKAEAFDECEANLNEVKKQLKIKIRHARRDGDYSEASAFSEALDMIEDSI